MAWKPIIRRFVDGYSVYGPELEQRLCRRLLRVKGRWCYLYRAIDSAGVTIDFLSSALRDAKERHQHGSSADLRLGHRRH